MGKIIYTIVEHDSGWAYKVDDTYSETFRTHDMARAAAKVAALEQIRPGDDVGISYEDANGAWHEELADGEDRPDPVVVG